MVCLLVVVIMIFCLIELVVWIRKIIRIVKLIGYSVDWLFLIKMVLNIGSMVVFSMLSIDFLMII